MTRKLTIHTIGELVQKNGEFFIRIDPETANKYHIPIEHPLPSNFKVIKKKTKSSGENSYYLRDTTEFETDLRNLQLFFRTHQEVTLREIYTALFNEHQASYHSRLADVISYLCQKEILLQTEDFCGIIRYFWIGGKIK